ncbi:MAG: hypothetical protein PHY34_01995 [Patescibacteria group bacterium]|nr:hypothetical protein [Patescibacteria group bacterium]MDD5715293.1 hypothetical protein [Patescibacteria group bacterium]
MPEHTSDTFNAIGQHDSPPTTGDAPDERIPVTEVGEPAETTLESVNNVEQLLAAWLKESRETTDKDRKVELAYCILQMKQALGLAQLDASEVRIRDYDPGTGTVGFYEEQNGQTGQVGITPKGLELPPEHFADVLVHESAHAGKNTHGRRIFDEGFCELLTVKILPNAIRGFYQKEQQKARELFDEAHMNDALEKYDFDNPMALVVYYLGVELHDRWSRVKADFAREQSDPAFDEAAFLKKFLDDNEDIEQQLKEGAPDIYRKIEAVGLDYDKAALDILKHLAA